MQTGHQTVHGISAAALLIVLAVARIGWASESPGLLIVAHGSPMPAWNKPVFALEKEVLEVLGKDHSFKEVKVVMMEFAKPDVAEGIRVMEKAGCDRIVVVPLLIAPSSHSLWDIPSLLGLYTDPEMRQQLEDEGAAITRTKLPITVTSTLHRDDLLAEIMLTRAKEISTNPAEEALVVIAHGDDGLRSHWDKLMKRITSHACGKTGITYADWAYVHVGQTYLAQGTPVIAAAMEKRKRVLLVGVYLSLGASQIHEMQMRLGKKSGMIAMMVNPLAGKLKRVVATKHGVIPDPRLARWIAKTARDAARTDAVAAPK